MSTCYHFTDLLIMQKYNQVFHDGICETLNLIRETYCSRHGRKSVKKVHYKYVACRRYEGKVLLTPPSPQLPNDHVGDHLLFAVTRIDFAGLLYVNTGQGLHKSYICLFTCGVTRAVHLDLSCKHFAGSQVEEDSTTK